MELQRRYNITFAAFNLSNTIISVAIKNIKSFIIQWKGVQIKKCEKRKCLTAKSYYELGRNYLDRCKCKVYGIHLWLPIFRSVSIVCVFLISVQFIK